MYDRVRVLDACTLYNTYASTYMVVLRQLGNGMQIAVRFLPVVTIRRDGTMGGRLRRGLKGTVTDGDVGGSTVQPFHHRDNYSPGMQTN